MGSKIDKILHEAYARNQLGKINLFFESRHHYDHKFVYKPEKVEDIIKQWKLTHGSTRGEHVTEVGYFVYFLSL